MTTLLLLSSVFKKPKFLLAATLIFLFGGVTSFFSIFSGFFIIENSYNKSLLAENDLLKQQISDYATKIDFIENKLEQIHSTNEKLRELSVIADRDRDLWVSPNASAPLELGEIEPYEPMASDFPHHDATFQQLQRAVLNSRLDGLTLESARQSNKLSELVLHLEKQNQLLVSAPSIWPTRGWVTSNFGSRTDPHTGKRQMHLGLDIATRVGTPVIAPSSGTIVFTGERGSYGNMVAIDHGFGIATHYGHLSEIFVSVGEKVERGNKIAAVGNTGRTTGPHLHYEVRQYGMAVDPRKFILN